MLGTSESIGGNVVTDHIAAGFGADGGHVQSLTIGGITYTFTPGDSDGTGSISKSGTAQTGAPLGYTGHGTRIEITTAIGGKLTFYFRGQQWSSRR